MNLALKSTRSVRGNRASMFHGGWFTVTRLYGPVRESHLRGELGRGYIWADIEIPDDLRDHVSVAGFNADGTIRVQVAVSIDEVIRDAIAPALAILPSAMDSRPARVMLMAIGLQESHFEARRQMNGGPARGFWQFEQGTAKSRGGVWGVYLHDASRYWLNVLCEARHVAFDPAAIYGALEHDDVLAAGVARLLLFTDPPKLPAADDAAGAWAVYLRTWRPGKPRPESWPEFHRQAVGAVGPDRNAGET